MFGQRESLRPADVRHPLNAFQQQSLVLGLVCFAASLFFFGVMRSARNTWFSRVIAVNLVTLTLIFAALAVIELGGERAEIAAALISELPFEAVVACLCVAQAGHLPLPTGAPPLALVAAPLRWCSSSSNGSWWSRQCFLPPSPPSFF